MSTNYLDTVKALLAKAEHPSTPQAEAENATAKALAMMAKHGIDEARLRSAQTHEKAEARVVSLRNPLAKIQALMLNNVAPTLGVRVVMSQERSGSYVGQMHLFGFSADIDRVQTMQTSLMTQMTRTLAQVTIPAGESPKKYKNAWRIGFITRVARRLKQAQHEAAEQDHATSGGTSTDMILRDRDQEVWDALRKKFPRTTKYRAGSSSSTRGTWAGYDAGGRADLGNRRTVGTRRQIGS